MCDRSIFKYCCGCIPQRHLLGLMAFIGIAVSYTLRNCLSMAITEMVKEPMKKNVTESADACPVESDIAQSTKYSQGDFDWSEAIQGHVLGSFYWGYIITHVPGGIIADKMGGKHVFGGGILITAIMSLVSPVSAFAHHIVLIIVRFISGLGSGVIFPAVNVLLAHWIPPLERGRMGAMIFAGTQIGNVIANSISGILLHYLGWTSVFYFFGILGVIWYILWLLICYSDPDDHPFINEDEKTYVQGAIIGLGNRPTLKQTPIFKILTSCPVWALIICQFGHNWGLFTMQNDLPKYMKSVLKYSSAKNGFVSSLPFLAIWISAIFSGFLSDFLIKKEILSVIMTRRILTLISQVGPGFGCVAAVYAGCNRWLVVALFTLGMGLMGPFYPSMRVNPLDLSPNYAGFLMALINGLGSAAGGLCSQTIGMIVHENSFKEWQIVFWLSNAIISGTGIWYFIFASASLQPWNSLEAPPPAN